jgi:hypothetical protein
MILSVTSLLVVAVAVGTATSPRMASTVRHLNQADLSLVETDAMEDDVEGCATYMSEASTEVKRVSFSVL